MIRADQIKLPIDYSDVDVKKGVARTLGVSIGEIKQYEIIKKSIDSRDKSKIRYVLSVGVELNGESKYLARHPKATVYIPPARRIESILPKDVPTPMKRPVIVGLGPAGLFAGLTLAKAGLRPIILERGKSVDERTKRVEDFINTCVLDTQSNLQFGEGGAGTFSDGKLNTGTGSALISVVFGEFVKFGAPSQILYDAKPHVGTDKLRDVIKNMRSEILSLGGEVYFNSRFVDFKTSGGKLAKVEIETKDRGRWSVDCDCCIIAV